MLAQSVRHKKSPWLSLSKQPRRAEKMKMVRNAIKLIMKNHFYSFYNKIMKQGKGGAIGNVLTDEMTQSSEVVERTRTQ